MESYLSHHGIKGQKWGIRRFQNEDGTLTEEGRKRYGIGLEKAKAEYEQAKKEYENLPALAKSFNTKENQFAKQRMEFAKEQYQNEKAYQKINSETKISDRRKKLQEKYKSQGLSEEDAALAAYKRERTEKILAIAAGVTIASVGAYLAYKHWDRYADKFIKSGQTLQNLSVDSSKGTSDAFYATYKKADNNKYLGLFAGGHLQKNGPQDVFKLNAKVNQEGLKIAAQKNGNKVLAETMRSDEKFKGAVAARLASTFGDNFDKIIKRIENGKTLTSKEYDHFNQLLVDHDVMQQKLTDRFYAELKKRGYGALQDVNDKYYSGYNAKSPIIVFDGARKLGERVLSQVPEEVYKQKYNKELAKLVGRMGVKTFLQSAAVWVMPTAAGTAVTKAVYNRQRQKAVQQYKKEHPGTKLTDKQILRNIYGFDK